MITTYLIIKEYKNLVWYKITFLSCINVHYNYKYLYYYGQKSCEFINSLSIVLEWTEFQLWLWI